MTHLEILITFFVYISALIMSEQGSTQSMRLSLSNWMRDLPAQLKDIPLIYLAIPGEFNTLFLVAF